MDVDVDEVKSIFCFFSNDGGEHIALDNVGDVLRVMGRTPTDAQVQSLCSSLREKDSVTLEEFIPMYHSVRNASELSGSETLTNCLSQFDRDGNGYVRAVELRNVLTTMGEKLSEQEVDDLLSGQQDTDGNVNIAKFVQCIMNE